MKSLKLRLILIVFSVLLSGFFGPTAGFLNVTLGFGISIMEVFIAFVLLLLFRPGKSY